MKESSNYCYNYSNIGISDRCGKKYSKNILDIEYLFVIKTNGKGNIWKFWNKNQLELS